MIHNNEIEEKLRGKTYKLFSSSYSSSFPFFNWNYIFILSILANKFPINLDQNPISIFMTRSTLLFSVMRVLSCGMSIWWSLWTNFDWQARRENFVSNIGWCTHLSQIFRFLCFGLVVFRPEREWNRLIKINCISNTPAHKYSSPARPNRTARARGVKCMF
jgi:hypothetical protein